MVSVADRYSNETTTKDTDLLQQELVNIRIREVGFLIYYEQPHFRPVHAIGTYHTCVNPCMDSHIVGLDVSIFA